MGPMGPLGPMGPMGPKGPMGLLYMPVATGWKGGDQMIRILDILENPLLGKWK